MAWLVNISESYKKFHVVCGLCKENFRKSLWPLAIKTCSWTNCVVDHPQILKTQDPIGISDKSTQNGGLLWGAWQDANNSGWPKYLGRIFNRSKEFNRGRCKVSTGSGNFDDYRKLTDMKLFKLRSFQTLEMFQLFSNKIHVSYLSPPVPYIVPILFSLIIIIGSIGNLLVVLVIYLNKTMRNNTNILILNLAVRAGTGNVQLKVWYISLN